eukprot:s2307_g1.t2
MCEILKLAMGGYVFTKNRGLDLGCRRLEMGEIWTRGQGMETEEVHGTTSMQGREMTKQTGGQGMETEEVRGTTSMQGREMTKQTGGRPGLRGTSANLAAALRRLRHSRIQMIQNTILIGLVTSPPSGSEMGRTRCRTAVEETFPHDAFYSRSFPCKEHVTFGTHTER